MLMLMRTMTVNDFFVNDCHDNADNVLTFALSLRCRDGKGDLDSTYKKGPQILALKRSQQNSVNNQRKKL